LSIFPAFPGLDRLCGNFKINGYHFVDGVSIKRGTPETKRSLQHVIRKTAIRA